MRLIDADELLKDVENYSPFGACLADIYDAQWLIGAQPTVDAVEVVRCKDCKHWWKNNELCVHPKCCKAFVAVVEAPETHFCSYGERRTDA